MWPIEILFKVKYWSPFLQKTYEMVIEFFCEWIFQQPRTFILSYANICVKNNFPKEGWETIEPLFFDTISQIHILENASPA